LVLLPTLKAPDWKGVSLFLCILHWRPPADVDNRAAHQFRSTKILV